MAAGFGAAPLRHRQGVRQRGDAERGGRLSFRGETEVPEVPDAVLLFSVLFVVFFPSLLFSFLLCVLFSSVLQSGLQSFPSFFLGRGG